MTVASRGSRPPGGRGRAPVTNGWGYPRGPCGRRRAGITDPASGRGCRNPTEALLLALTDLRKRYGAVAALDGLSLTAEPGRLVGFLGPNGAGKTTAMRAVFGLVRLDTGTVRWQGRAITQDDRLRFGYMPEQRGLYPRMAVHAQLVYLARLRGLDPGRADRAATRWVERLDLADRADDPVSSLSHGNQQRVQLAASLVHEPDLLVLDEPFNGLDPLGVAAMSDVLRDRAGDGATVVFSSHQLDLVEHLCDDVVIVARGRDVLAGDLESVRVAAPHRRVQVRLAGGAVPAAPDGADEVSRRDGLITWRVARDTDPGALLDTVRRSGRVERFAFEPPTLSEIFRETVGITVEALEARHAEAGDSAEVPG